MAEPESPKQLWLLNYKNPLIARFGAGFFKSIPKVPGVYLMRDERGVILYVGKAKVLRDRLRSYTHVNADNSSRKILRLLHLVRRIEWERLKDEKSALLRENHLLREHQPFFNVMNTSPHTYLFVHSRQEEAGIRLHLAMNEDGSYADVYGAFKGLGLVYRAHKALLRLLWISFHPCRHGFELPGHFTNRKKLAHTLVPWPVEDLDRTDFYRKMRRFFKGTSEVFLGELCQRILAREDLAPFMNRFVQEDIETLREFYARGTKRNCRIKRQLKTGTHVMPQSQLDDYLVLLNHEK